MAEDFDKKYSKLEDAISKLTDISADLNKVLAVHELRLTQQEKTTNSIEIILEKRRDEYDSRERDLYDTIKSEDDKIVNKIQESHEKLSLKLSQLEKMMWVYGGGVVVLAFIVANWGDIIKIIAK